MTDAASQNDRSWLAEGMRLTAFLMPVERIPQDTLHDWWQDAVGSEPESTTSEQHGLKTRFSGAYLGGRLELSSTPSRLDWRVEPTLDEPPEEALEIPSLGPFEETKSQFLSFSKRWLAVSPVLRRLALGMTLTHPATGKPEALRLLQERIGRPCLDLSGVSDFVFRVNRRRPYRLKGKREIEINRLQTWSLVTYSVSTIELSQGGMEAVEQPGSVAGRLELDINTVPARVPELRTDFLVRLVEHLAELGTEIALEGDKP